VKIVLRKVAGYFSEKVFFLNKRNPDFYELLERMPYQRINPGNTISDLFLELGISDLKSAFKYIKSLEYRRPSQKNDLSLVIRESRGTCSGKHALAKKLTEENGIKGFSLHLGIFYLDEKLNPKIGEILFGHGLRKIPEAHAYLKWKGKIVDLTFPGDILRQHKFEDEIKINCDQIGLKEDYHKSRLQKWIIKNGMFRDIKFTEAWEIRERCIGALMGD
jgi:hypothetical protein